MKGIFLGEVGSKFCAIRLRVCRGVERIFTDSKSQTITQIFYLERCAASMVSTISEYLHGERDFILRLE